MANIHSYTSDDKIQDFFYTDSPLCEIAAVGRVTLLWAVVGEVATLPAPPPPPLLE